MGPVTKVIARVIVVEFYKQNAAFFGLILLVLFGFMRSTEHLAIGNFLVAYPSALFFLYGLWLSYVVKILLFTGPTIFKSENQFLCSFALLPLRDKLFSLILTSWLLFLPGVFYAVFLIYLGLQQGLIIPVISIILAVLFFMSLIGSMLYRKLSALPHERKILQIRFASKFPRSAWLYFTEHVLRNEPVLFFLTKAYSCLLIIGTALLYETDEYDLRLYTTGILLAFAGNVALLNKYATFYYHRVTFFRNLPLSTFSVLLFHFIAISVLMLPECVFVLKYYPLPFSWIDAAGLTLFGIGICIIIFSVTLLKNVDMEKIMTWMFWLIVGNTFLILFSVHPMILGILSTTAYTFILKRQHYQFEFTE